MFPPEAECFRQRRNTAPKALFARGMRGFPVLPGNLPANVQDWDFYQKIVYLSNGWEKDYTGNTQKYMCSIEVNCF